MGVSLPWKAVAPQGICVSVLAVLRLLWPVPWFPCHPQEQLQGVLGVRWTPVLALSGRVLSTPEASSGLAELGDLLSSPEVLLQGDSFHNQLS